MKSTDLKLAAEFLTENIERFGDWIADRYEMDPIEATVIVESLQQGAESLDRLRKGLQTKAAS